MKQRLKFTISVAFFFVLIFGGAMGSSVSVPNVHADADRQLTAQCEDCGAIETKQECVDNNQTLVTIYQRCYCPSTGWTTKILDQYFINGCIAS